MSRRTSIKLFHESSLAQIEGYMEYGFLIAAVIRCGLEDDGLDYLQTPGGQYWCLLGNVDPEVVRERAEAISQGTASVRCAVEHFEDSQAFCRKVRPRAIPL